jgi:acetyltransferase-like isoleucine patch superfamily enzyme
MTAILEHDWYPRPLPDNVVLGERSWLHSAHAFVHCHSRRPVAVAIGEDSGVYHGSHFELGPHGVVRIGRFCTLVGAIICTDGSVRIGDHTFVAHEVLIADGAWAVPPRAAAGTMTGSAADDGQRPLIEIGADVWIGARATILGGARIGAGAIVGAGAVVTGEVPAGSTVAGNPARVVRRGPWPA